MREPYSQEGDDAVPGDGLQQAGGPGQALKARPAGGEEGANHDDPGGRPGQRSDHQVAVHPFPKPGHRAEAQGRV